MRPNFDTLSTDIPSKELNNSAWETPEQIELKSSYTKIDIQHLKQVNYAAGIPPYLRGPYLSLIHI